LDFFADFTILQQDWGSQSRLTFALPLQAAVTYLVYVLLFVFLFLAGGRGESMRV
jgi:hypothetical protein